MAVKNLFAATLIACTLGASAQNNVRIAVDAWQPQIAPVSAGTPDNAIMRLNVKIVGSNAPLPLNSLVATAVDVNPVDSVKLFYTKTGTFDKNDTLNVLLGKTTIVNGKATFSDINFNLTVGSSYLWIACNTKADADSANQFANNPIDMKIEPNAISIGELTFPSDTLNPVGRCIIPLLDQGFESGFESGINSESTGWTEEYDTIFFRDQPNHPSMKWKFRNGGAKPAGTTTKSKPEKANSGNYNALLSLTTENENGKYLITPPIVFDNDERYVLQFSYSQYKNRKDFTNDSAFANFELKVCYRTIDGDTVGKWNVISEYDDATDDLQPWQRDSLGLPETISGKIQIGFLGVTKNAGYGCCIDDIQIFSTSNIPKYLYPSDITAETTTKDPIATGSSNNTILKLKINVRGNSGHMPLKSLTATALKAAAYSGQRNPVDSVKLYYTVADKFSTDNLWARTSIVNGQATFSNINRDLPSGLSYLWIACDIKNDTDHLFRDDTIGFKMAPYSIRLDTAYTSKELNPCDPDDYRKVFESIFIDGFEDTIAAKTTWTLAGEFEIDKPLGRGGNRGYADTEIAHNEEFVLGTDLTGAEVINGIQNVTPGDYEKQLRADQYFAETNEFDCYYYKNIRLMFYRWLNIAADDRASVYVTTTDSTSCVWKNTSEMTDKNWTFQNIDLKKMANRQSSVKVKFALGPTSKNWTYSGWNIDDVALVGTLIRKDAVLASIDYPNTGCGLSAEEPVAISIWNNGYDAIKGFTARYSINGGEWVTETVPSDSLNIARDATLTYTFKTKADLSKCGRYDIRAEVILTGEEREEKTDNSAQKNIMSLPYRRLPYAENFEGDTSYWYSRNWLRTNSSTWLHAEDVMPSGNTSYCWTIKTADYGYFGEKRYLANNTDTLESPCFDMRGVQKPILEFKLKGDAADDDGLAIYYSIDGGASWTFLPKYDGLSYEHPTWNWYNTNDDDIYALGTNGWSGYFDWTTVKQLLPDEAIGQPSMKLRFVFAAADDDYYEHTGFSIDDIKIYESPIDAGVAAIVEPTDQCELLKEQPITVRIKNYGVRHITTADSMLIASVRINDKITLTDTFSIRNAGLDTLAIGDSVDFTFRQTVNMWGKKTYNMTAFTRIPGDTMLFSNINNDTLRASATVLGEPLYGLSPSFGLGPDKGTTNPETCVIDGGMQSDSTDFALYEWTDNYGQPAKLSNGDLAGNVRQLSWLNPFPDGIVEYEYKVKVTNIYGCEARDTIKIINSQTDVGIAEVKNVPPQFCINNEFSNITVTVKNYSDEFAVEVGDTISICYELLDADSIRTLFAEDTIMAAQLPIGESFEYTFKKQPKFEYDGRQRISFFTLVRADLDNTNDTRDSLVTVWPLPTVYLRDDKGRSDSILTANPQALVLKTDFIEGATYSWLNYDDSVRNTFTVTDSTTAKYKVSVTDEHSCATVADSLLVVSDSWSLTSIVSPTDRCEPQSNADVTIVLANKSKNSYSAGYVIPTVIYFNSDTIVEHIVLTDSLKADTVVEYTFNSKVDMSNVGTYSLTVDIAPEHDINLDDNSRYKKLNVWGVPRLNIGPDTIFTLEPDTILLDAGTDFITFNWYEKGANDDYDANWVSDAQKLNVTLQGEQYIVNAANEHGCYAPDQQIKYYDPMIYDTVCMAADTITIIKYDLEIVEMLAPVPSCDIAQTNSIELRLKNKGLNPVKAGTTLPFLMTVNNNAPAAMNFTVQKEFKTDTTMTVRLPLRYAFNKDSVYAFKMKLNWKLDRFNNKEAVDTIYQYPHPANFSLGDNIYTTAPDTVVLHAPRGYNSYSWSNGTNADSLALPMSGTKNYSVSVRNSNGCSTSASIAVITYNLDFDVFTNVAKETMNSCSTASKAGLTGKISVLSLDEIPAGTDITASYTFDGNTEKRNITLAKTITPESPYTFAFKDSISLPDTGNYVIASDMKVNRIGVGMHEADTNNHKETGFRIGAYPIPFTDTVKTYDESYTIDAGLSFNTFSWEGEVISGQMLSVIKTGLYKLTAIDTNGCKAVDSTYILFIKPRYDITGIGFDTTYCAGDGTAAISFYLKNTGNDIIAAGSQSQISYVADSIRVDEVFTFEKTLRAGDSTLVTFNQNADFNTVGTHPVTISADIAGFVASALFNVTTLELPTVLLGDDVNSLEPTVDLTVKSGYSSYMWNTSDTTSSISVTEGGQYWVRVMHQNGCFNSDTVNVHFVPATITVTTMTNPVSQCGSITNDSIVIEILNNGDATIAAGRFIGVTCALADTVIRDSILLPWNFAKNATITHKMNNTLTLNTVGIHTLSFALDVDGEPKDTSEFTVEVYGLPEFTFGTDTLRPDEYPYVLAASPMSDVSYLWSTNETTQSIAINADGMYLLTVTDSNHCQAFNSVFVKKNVPQDTTGIIDFALNEVTVYPNPAKDAVNIDFKGAFTAGCRIMVARASGQIIFVSAQTSDIMKIDVSDWAQGVYLIRIINGNESRIIKFVKE